MVTDDERREVALKLRELASDAEEVSDFDLAKTLDLGAVSRYGYDPCDVDRLADLIEPSCDREALLEQAKELEKCAWYFGLDFDADEPLRDRLKEASEDFAECALRIREACGEVVE